MNVTEKRFKRNEYNIYAFYIEKTIANKKMFLDWSSIFKLDMGKSKQ